MILAEDVVKELVQEEPDEPVYVLRDTQITGELDLRHRTVHVAIDIQGCEFLGEVDLRYCEFKQAVNFSECTFRKDLNSGDETESHTVYRKDLICNKAVFEGAVSFNGCRVESSAYFRGAHFQNIEKLVDFSHASIEKAIECDAATFKGAARFNSLKCNSLLCNEVTFQGPASFNTLVCNDSGYFRNTKFASEEEADFTYASFNVILQYGSATFEGPASFNSIRCGRSGFFSGVEFRSRKEVDFVEASFGSNFDCRETTFEGLANFNSLKCSGAGLFVGARFKGEGEISFSHASFNVSLSCDRCTFAGPANFAWTQCGTLSCKSAMFGDEAIFNTLKCDSSGFFDNTRFEGKGGADFGHASFGVSLFCNNVNFKGLANFNAINCGDSGIFVDAEFEDEADFNFASFGKSLCCNRAIFKGPAGFNLLKCIDSAFFRNTKFEDTAVVNLIGASFGGNLEYTDALFKAGACFNRVECKGFGRFDRTRFESEDQVDFGFTHFRYGLDFKDAYFAGPVALTFARISQALNLSAARFQQELTLYGTTTGLLMLGETHPFEIERRGLDLRGCTFERFHGSKEVGERFAQAQDPTKFSRDPYLQLEKYYSSIGDEAEAKNTHYRGRSVLRQNAKDENGSTEWTLGKNVSDLFLKVFTGYGVKTNRVIIAIFAVLVIGGMVFSLDEIFSLPTALVARPSATSTASTPTVVDRLAYSVDQFIPVVSMQIKQKWEPGNQWYQAYAVVHAIAGWLLIPLFLASWSGLVRSR